MNKKFPSFMQELDWLAAILNKTGFGGAKLETDIPLISLEGLPGAGKTTQIELLYDSGILGNCKLVDLPSCGSTGMAMKTLHHDKPRWAEIADSVPWLNPLFIALEARACQEEAIKENKDCLLMSRGLISTYYYNLPPLLKWGMSEEEGLAFLRSIITECMRPSAVIFLELPPEEAHKRVELRHRLPFRKMDELESMEKDIKKLKEYAAYVHNYVPVHYVDASGDKYEVQKKIEKVVESFPFLKR